jgi:hypothetical protein
MSDGPDDTVSPEAGAMLTTIVTELNLAPLVESLEEKKRAYVEAAGTLARALSLKRIAQFVLDYPEFGEVSLEGDALSFEFDNDYWSDEQSELAIVVADAHPAAEHTVILSPSVGLIKAEFKVDVEMTDSDFDDFVDNLKEKCNE